MVETTQASTPQMISEENVVNTYDGILFVD